MVGADFGDFWNLRFHPLDLTGFLVIGKFRHPLAGVPEISILQKKFFRDINCRPFFMVGADFRDFWDPQTGPKMSILQKRFSGISIVGRF